jgi:hypothetical protein
VEGIKVLTDGNDFNGSMEQLLRMCLKWSFFYSSVI